MSKKKTLFQINISYDEETKMYIPEIAHTEAAEKLDRRDQVGIIEDCIGVITRTIKSGGGCGDRLGKDD